nr:hypothetical protein [Tanacetum cinerariifolium]
KTELITLDLICPLTYQLLWNSSGDSGPDLSFDKSASLDHLFSLARVSLAEASKPVLSFECSGGDYTSSCPPGLTYLDAMVWRHPDAAIDDPRPSACSFNKADVRRLSTHVVKLRDMPEGVLVLSGLSRVWKSFFVIWYFEVPMEMVQGWAELFCVISFGFCCLHLLLFFVFVVIGIHDFLCLPKWIDAEVQEEQHLDARSTLQRLPFYCTPSATIDVVIPKPTPEDLAAGTPSSKILAKVEASQKRKASTSVATSGHVVKRTRSTLAQSPSSTTRPNLFVGDSDDENDGRSSAAPAAPATEVFNIQGIMVNDAAIPSGGEMARVESLFDDQLATKMSVLHCMMMSHSGKLLARYRGLNRSHHEYVLLADSRLKGYEEKYNAKGKERKKKIKSLTKSLDNLHSEVQNFFASDEFSRVQGKLLSLAARAGFERRLSMHWTKDEFDVVLKMVNFMPGAQDRLFEASPLGTCVSPHIAKESTVTPVSESLELSANVNFTASAVASEHNEEMVNTEGRVPSGLDDVVVTLSAHEKGFCRFQTITSRPPHIPEQMFISYIRIYYELLVFPSSLVVIFSLHDVVVHWSPLLGRRDHFVSSSSLMLKFSCFEFAFPYMFCVYRMGYIVLLDICYDYKFIKLLSLASRLRFGFVPGVLLVAFPFLLPFVSSIYGLVLIPTDTSWLRNSSFMVANPINTSTFGFRVFGRYAIRNLWNGAVAYKISSLHCLSYSVAGVRFPST